MIPVTTSSPPSLPCWFPSRNGKSSFQAIKEFRRSLKTSDGIYVKKEFHAWKFVSGRGQIAPHVVTKRRRAEIFIETLAVIMQLPGIQIINACDERGTEMLLFERLLNRINVAMRKATPKSHALVLSDEGKEGIYTALARRIAVHNPIPSQFGSWKSGLRTKNQPTERIVEDIMFKDSSRSYFIQMADFCAYALLRNQNPLPSKSKYYLDRAFTVLESVLVKEAFQADPWGIIRARAAPKD